MNLNTTNVGVGKTGFQVYQLFEQQVARQPDVSAVSFNETKLSYRQLHDLVCQLADRIVALPTVIIGVSSTRSINMLVHMLAVLKAGKSYLPLDITHPAGRLKQVVAEAGMVYCLCEDQEADYFRSLGVQRITDTHIATGESTPVYNELAYVLYTSGSTGRPKGVCMGQGALYNLIQWQQQHSVAGLGSKTLQFAPLGFDVSFQEILATLSTGGELVMVVDDIRIDAERLLAFLEEKQVNRIFLPFIALQLLAEAAVSSGLYPAHLKEVMTAGEQLKITPHVRSFFEHLPHCTLYNQYGPTECHVVTQLQLTGNAMQWPLLPSIGRPISNTAVYILDPNKQLVTDGEAGELCIAGTCLGQGYLNQPALTHEKFIHWQHPQKGMMRIYRTGDVARVQADGTIEFTGRADDQVKIRGYRIEPAEVEMALHQLHIAKDVVVTVREDMFRNKQLVAYLLLNEAAVATATIKAQLAAQLPDYMIPSAFVWLNEYPVTASGKVDKKALPEPVQQRDADTMPAYKKPVTALEIKIAEVWEQVLQVTPIGNTDHFFELGGNSLLAQKLVLALRRQQLVVPVIKLYQYPTVTGQAAFLSGEADKVYALPEAAPVAKAQGDIAIVGMGCRLPGADTIEAFWDMLTAGREGIHYFTDAELDATVTETQRGDAAYVKARGIIKNAAGFDAAFWGISPRLAALMDPQQRVFLEIARDVLEYTGHLPDVYAGTIGIYAGSGSNAYFINNVLTNPQAIEQAGTLQVNTLNEKEYLSSRTAYHLNLKGPAVSVFSACSTSLLAIAQATEALRNGQCQVALAGGVSITAPVNTGQLYQEGAMFSRDGHTCSFDASATGTVFSDGAGVVLLKPLDAAIQAGDTIYAVIKGIGVNNDGGNKASFTAPDALGQAGAIRRALQDAAITPDTINYIEAHGTATPVGDPIEIEGLKLAFGNQLKKQYCALGSVKSNIGHLTHAAGVAGIIKTALALYHQQLPATINYRKPNPEIDFANSPFYVNSTLSLWPGEGIRRAGVSSFGVGGTNVHVIVEGYQQATPVTAAQPDAALISWSAHSAESVALYAQKLKTFIAENPQAGIGDIAFTLHTTRARFAFRHSVAVTGIAHLQQLLEAGAAVQQVPAEVPGVAFLFPGQGAQFAGMGKALYQAEPVYRQAVEECAAIITALTGDDIKVIIYGEDVQGNRLTDTRYTQPALFTTEYAMARLWMSWGIQPALLIGHSIGEFVAAHLAGVFGLRDALLLVTSRARLTGALPAGAMLSVRAAAHSLPALLPGMSIAAVNAPELCVVAGSFEAVEAYTALLNKADILHRRLATSHAFHSAMMEPAMAPFLNIIRTIPLQVPRKPIVSTVTGKWLTDTEATDALYWAQHMLATVQFAPAITFAVNEQSLALLEVGPGKTLATLARQATGRSDNMVLPGIADDMPQAVYAGILASLGRLWQTGVEPDWQAFYAQSNNRRIHLPAYAYDRKTYWLQPQVNRQVVTAIPAALPVTESNAAVAAVEVSRIARLKQEIATLLEDASGITITPADYPVTFIELGMDSLLLTQTALSVQKLFKVPVSFRQLNDNYSSVALLADYLDKVMPPDAPEEVTETTSLPINSGSDAPLDVIMRQLADLSKQVAALQHPAAKAVAPVVTADITLAEAQELKKPFGAAARIDKQGTVLNAVQQQFLQQLTQRYTRKTQQSKYYTQQHRPHMADPRVVTGFKPQTKELVYSLVVNKSQGCRLWDIDGNEYIDVLNGFGSGILGYQSPVIKQAVLQQVDEGYEIGPQHALSGEVCRLICSFTGFDRAALCNTGSEAVLGAMRIARTVTGRSLIVAFNGSYHGINDEVIVRGTQKLKSFPAAPGIPAEAVQNMLILDYGTERSLQIIRERAHELAAVLVEPVQSRRPEFRPVTFLKELREVTRQAGTVLIFDEVITGFRSHPGGAQALFDIQADIGTYGKVIGGGMPIGAIAGKKQFMDALDGGFWQYGDDSVPEAGVTYFAGTFVRHPLALAAAKATLEYMQQQGPALQEGINTLTDYLATALNRICRQMHLPVYAVYFASLWKLKFHEEYAYSELLFTLLREKGIHIWDGFPCFLTAAHTQREVDSIIEKFRESAEALREGQLMPVYKVVTAARKALPRQFDLAPDPRARLGKDAAGNPGWFMPDPQHPGSYIQIVES